MNDDNDMDGLYDKFNTATLDNQQSSADVEQLKQLFKESAPNTWIDLNIKPFISNNYELSFAITGSQNYASTGFGAFYKLQFYSDETENWTVSWEQVGFNKFGAVRVRIRPP
jgi:hypothetical protein